MNKKLQLLFAIFILANCNVKSSKDKFEDAKIRTGISGKQLITKKEFQSFILNLLHVNDHDNESEPFLKLIDDWVKKSPEFLDANELDKFSGEDFLQVMTNEMMSARYTKEEIEAFDNHDEL